MARGTIFLLFLGLVGGTLSLCGRTCSLADSGSFFATQPQPLFKRPFMPTSVSCSGVAMIVKGDVKHPGLHCISLGASARQHLEQALIHSGAPASCKHAAVPAQTLSLGPQEIVVGYEKNRSCNLLLRPIPAPLALLLGQKLDINLVSSDDLVVIPGIGESTAKAIVDARNHLAGGFSSLEQLLDCRGIGVKRLENLSSFLFVGAPDNNRFEAH